MLATNISNGFYTTEYAALFEKYTTTAGTHQPTGGLRIAVTHNDQRLDKAGSNALSSPCAQRAQAHQEH